MSNISIGSDCFIWDFGFRYNIALMTEDELNVIMIKYKTELRKHSCQSQRYLDIESILSDIYKFVMAKKRKESIQKHLDSRSRIA